MKHETYVAPASAVSSAWVGAEDERHVDRDALARQLLRVASRPASQNGTLTTMCSCSVRSAWPSRDHRRGVARDDLGRRRAVDEIADALDRLARIAVLLGQQRRVGGRAGEDAPRRRCSSTSATEPVSMKSLMTLSLPRSGRIHFSARRRRRTRRQLGSSPAGPGATRRWRRDRRPTSCTRRIAAPARARTQPRRASPAGGRRARVPVIAPRKYLREIAASTGRPSALSSPNSRSTAIDSRRRLGEVGARVERSRTPGRGPPPARPPSARAGTPTTSATTWPR